MGAEYVMLVVGLVLAFGLAGASLVTYLRYAGPRSVACPGDGRSAAVRVDARHAAFTAVPRPVLRVQECSRWPQRAHCGQVCLDQVEADRTGSPVALASRWYTGRRCVRCGAPFVALRWVDRPPALMDRDGALRAWHEVPREQLASDLTRYLPVCWGCHAVESLRLEEADLGRRAGPREATRDRVSAIH